MATAVVTTAHSATAVIAATHGLLCLQRASALPLQAHPLAPTPRLALQARLHQTHCIEHMLFLTLMMHVLHFGDAYTLQ